MRENGTLEFYSVNNELQAGPGDTVISLTRPTKELVKLQERIEADRTKQSQSKE